MFLTTITYGLFILHVSLVDQNCLYLLIHYLLVYYSKIRCLRIYVVLFTLVLRLGVSTFVQDFEDSTYFTILPTLKVSLGDEW